MSEQHTPTAGAPQTTEPHNPEIYVADPTVEQPAPTPAPVYQATSQHTAPTYQAAPQYQTPQAQPTPAFTPAAQAPQTPAATAPRPSKSTRLADTNTYALVSILLAFICPIAGIVFGHIALSQIKKTGDAGQGIATTGTILGYTFTALGALLFIGYISLMIMWAASGFGPGSMYL